jgi:hypothetical protein
MMTCCRHANSTIYLIEKDLLEKEAFKLANYYQRINTLTLLVGKTYPAEQPDDQRMRGKSTITVLSSPGGCSVKGSSTSFVGVIREVRGPGLNVER